MNTDENIEEIYHVFTKGKEGQQCFFDENDRRKFLSILNKIAHRFKSEIYAFVLMDNHFHILIRSKDVGKLILYVIQSYTGWFCSKYKKSGPVFQYPVPTIPKQRLDWIIDSLLYILNNPVAAGISKQAGGYYYCSYSFYTKRPNRLSEIIDINTSLYRNNFKSIKDLKMKLAIKMKYQKAISMYKYEKHTSFSSSKA